MIVERPSQADRVFTYSYDLAGRLATIEYPAETGIVAYFGETVNNEWVPDWNPNGQLLRLRYLKNGAHLHSFEYDYDDAGNRKTFIDTPQNTANAIRWEYSYTWLNQLAEVKRGDGGATPVTVSLYAYDESDNRIELQLPQLDEVHTYTYNAADEIVDRSVAVGAGLPVVMETFSHDADGNMTGRVLDPNGSPQSTTYTWSDFDRLIGIGTPTSSLSNSYDAGGIRKRKVGSDGVAVKSFYSGLPPVSESESSSGGISEICYLMGHQLLGFEKDSQHFYFIADGLSSVRALVSWSGTVVGEVAHDEFGNRVLGSGTTTSKTYVGGLGVTDETENTELMYMRQRWYDPGLGRFLSQDPIGFIGGLNQFVYVSNNPASLVDPKGLQGTTHGEEWKLFQQSYLQTHCETELTDAEKTYYAVLGGALHAPVVVMMGQAAWTAFLADPVKGTLVLESVVAAASDYPGPSSVIPAPGRIPVSASQISPGEAARIQGVANRLGTRVVVVGSRAKPACVQPIHDLSDWDFVIPGAKSKLRNLARKLLPRGQGGGELKGGGWTGQDVSGGGFMEDWYHVIFDPE